MDNASHEQGTLRTDHCEAEDCPLRCLIGFQLCVSGCIVLTCIKDDAQLAGILCENAIEHDSGHSYTNGGPNLVTR